MPRWVIPNARFACAQTRISFTRLRKTYCRGQNAKAYRGFWKLEETILRFSSFENFSFDFSDPPSAASSYGHVRSIFYGRLGPSKSKDEKYSDNHHVLRKDRPSIGRWNPFGTDNRSRRTSEYWKNAIMVGPNFLVVSSFRISGFFSMQLAVDVQLPTAFAGVNGSAVFLDTECCYKPKRLEQIARAAVQHINEIASTSGI